MGGLLSSSSSSSNNKNKRSKHNIPVITSHDRARLDLKNARDKIHQSRKKLEHHALTLQDKARGLARENKELNKNKILTMLKLRKMYVNRCDELEEQLLNIHTLLHQIDSTLNDQILIKALSEGKESLAKLNQEIGGAEKVMELIESIEEEVEMQREISDAIATPVGDIDVTEELEALEAELFSRIAATSSASLPEAPSKPLPEMKIAIDDEQKELVTSRQHAEPLPS